MKFLTKEAATESFETATKHVYHDFGYSYKLPKKTFARSQKVGVSSGGDCWGGVAKYAPVGGGDLKSQDFKGIDLFLSEVFPEITFLQYKTLNNNIETSGVRYYTDSEYYGNYTEYEYEYITLDDLVEFLNDNFCDE